MPLVLTSPPGVAPVSLAAAKAHLKVDDKSEDKLIEEFIAAAVRRIELETALALVSQKWKFYRDCWPSGAILQIPITPVQSIDGIKVRTSAGKLLVDEKFYEVDTASSQARIRALSGFLYPAPRLNAVEISLTAGFGDAGENVPAPLRQAVLMLVAHWFENREGHGEKTRAGMPVEVRDLLAPWRRTSL